MGWGNVCYNSRRACLEHIYLNVSCWFRGDYFIIVILIHEGISHPWCVWWEEGWVYRPKRAPWSFLGAPRRSFAWSRKPPITQVRPRSEFALTHLLWRIHLSMSQWTDPVLFLWWSANRWTDPILPLTAPARCSPDPWPHPAPCCQLPTGIMGINLLNISIHSPCPSLFLYSWVAFKTLHHFRQLSIYGWTLDLTCFIFTSPVGFLAE